MAMGIPAHSLIFNYVLNTFTLSSHYIHVFNPEYSLEGLILKLKLQYFGHLMWRVNLLEKTLMLGKIEGRRRRGRQRMASPIQWTQTWANTGRWCGTESSGVLQSMGSQRVGHNLVTKQQQRAMYFVAMHWGHRDERYVIPSPQNLGNKYIDNGQLSCTWHVQCIHDMRGTYKKQWNHRERSWKSNWGVQEASIEHAYERRLSRLNRAAKKASGRGWGKTKEIGKDGERGRIWNLTLKSRVITPCLTLMKHHIARTSHINRELP